MPTVSQPGKRDLVEHPQIADDDRVRGRAPGLGHAREPVEDSGHRHDWSAPEFVVREVAVGRLGHGHLRGQVVAG